MKRLLFAIIDHRCPHISAALKDADDSGFVLPAGPGDPALSLRNMHVPSLAADECLIDFDFTVLEFGEKGVQVKFPQSGVKPGGLKLGNEEWIARDRR